MDNLGFKLFPCYIPVSGFSRTIICDLQRGEYRFVLPRLTKLFDDVAYITPEVLESNLKDPNLMNCLNKLIHDEYGFWCSPEESTQFVKMRLVWNKQSYITNAIIDSDESSDHDFPLISNQLKGLGCKCAQLRFFDTVESNKLESIIKTFERNAFTDLEVFLKWKTNQENDLLKLAIRYPCLRKTIIHSSVRNRVVFTGFNDGASIFETTDKVASESHCGFVHESNFNVAIDQFTESLEYNSSLNRKISIDRNGDIRNCPAMPRAYGNIGDTELRKVFTNIEFQELWYVNKDQVDVCKDCEFRYICLDCRAFSEPSKKRLGKPTKCSYNPYTGSWEEDGFTPNLNKARVV